MLRLILALVAGGLLALGFQPWNLWPLPIIGIALLTGVVAGRPVRASFGLGLAAGLVLNYLCIWWVSVQSGPAIHALIAVMACWVGLAAGLTTVLLRLKGAILLVPTAWVCVEFGAGTFPFRGFPWLRLGHTTIDQPMAGWLPLVATPGVTWLVAFVGCLLLRMVTTRSRLAPALTIAGVFAVGGLMTLRPVEQPEDHVVVGMVQGNVALDLDTGYIAATGATPNHLSETVFLLAEARSRGVGLDFILWAENSTDRDPLLHGPTRRQVEWSARLAEVPLFIGAVMAGPQEGTRQTVSLWWTPEEGITDRYAKRNLAPFGEWVPYRDLLEPVFPDVARVGAQSVPGATTGVLEVSTAHRPALRVGTVICYELAYDKTVAELSWHGAQVLVAQSTTHNFTGTSEPLQQMTINRVRAAELGREFVASTLNGYSGLIDVRGRVHEPTVEGTAAHRILSLPLREGTTPAVFLGVVIQGLCAVLAVGAALHAIGNSSTLEAPSTRKEPR
ncbi:apolipoprotein N-acyltransferase [Arachnia propionica]|uniref:Apolipoprotein N-acyltransferase n=1 Tax=Arachnia propionica TaxID=1750 RepID=A0A3P1TCG7_9ACTN|nr:apolipoprotein N-acyltransferase [Arachnia propionica]MDO5082006.1 apolipoprotein N-acyltransferase [Arachnia propionica]RRD07152.1 apolipoprotein N-acyltransferase [Arachnia propionica]